MITARLAHPAHSNGLPEQPESAAWALADQFVLTDVSCAVPTVTGSADTGSKSKRHRPQQESPVNTSATTLTPQTLSFSATVPPANALSDYQVAAQGAVRSYADAEMTLRQSATEAPSAAVTTMAHAAAGRATRARGESETIKALFTTLADLGFRDAKGLGALTVTRDVICTAIAASEPGQCPSVLAYVREQIETAIRSAILYGDKADKMSDW